MPPTAYWAALDLAGSAADGESRRRTPVGELEPQYPSDAAVLAEDLPVLCVHLGYPLRLRKRLRSTILLERSLGEVKRLKPRRWLLQQVCRRGPVTKVQLAPRLPA